MAKRLNDTCGIASSVAVVALFLGVHSWMYVS